MEFTQWNYIPLDLIEEQFMYLNTARDIENFCEDSAVYKRVCQNENGRIWRQLFYRDFSDTIKLREDETIKSQYLKDKSKIENYNEMEKFGLAINNEYEHVINNLDYTKLTQKNIYNAFRRTLKTGNTNKIIFLIENLSKNIKIDEAILEDVFMSSAHAGKLESIKFLAQKGIGNGFIGEFSLILAASNKQLRAIEYLLNMGVNIDSALTSAIGIIDLAKRHTIIQLLNSYR